MSTRQATRTADRGVSALSSRTIEVTNSAAPALWAVAMPNGTPHTTVEMPRLICTITAPTTAPPDSLTRRVAPLSAGQNARR